MFLFTAQPYIPTIHLKKWNVFLFINKWDVSPFKMTAEGHQPRSRQGDPWLSKKDLHFGEADPLFSHR
jgi:hypothetical protein